MGKIQTVCGDIIPSEAGITSMHDHTAFKTNDLAGILLKSMPDIGRSVTSIEGGADIGRESEYRRTLSIEVPKQSMDRLHVEIPCNATATVHWKGNVSEVGSGAYEFY